MGTFVGTLLVGEEGARVVGLKVGVLYIVGCKVHPPGGHGFPSVSFPQNPSGMRSKEYAWAKFPVGGGGLKYKYAIATAPPM